MDSPSPLPRKVPRITRVRRAGNVLIVEKNASFPPRCIKTNQPTAHFINHYLYSSHPALLLVLVTLCLCGPVGVALAIVALALRTREATFKLPFLSAAITGTEEVPLLLERFCAAEKVAPESVERENRISSLPRAVSSQTTLTLPSESTASHGSDENPELLEMLIGAEKDAPPLLDRV